MQDAPNSLPARPSLEQLRKLAKELVRGHDEKQPDALALIARHLPALAGKTAPEVAVYVFALHDAHSVLARQYGFASWDDLRAYFAGLEKAPLAPTPDLTVAAKLLTAMRGRETNDYALWSSVMSDQFNALVPKEAFEASTKRLSIYLRANYRMTYIGTLNSPGRPIHFWRMWVDGWESDLLVRMSLNEARQISGLLFSPPFDTAMQRK